MKTESDSMAHPLFQKRTNLNIYIAVWSAITIVHTTVVHTSQAFPLRLIALDAVIFNGLFAALGICLWYVCKYQAFDRQRFFKIVENHAFASLLASAIWLGAGYVLIAYVFMPPPDYVAWLKASMVWRGLMGVLYYFITIAFYHLFILSNRLREKAVKEAELQTLVKEAELRSLKFQVNPHFIFNSLNSINSLTMTDPEKAGEMTVKLGEYLRYTLSKGEEKTSLLRDELDSMRLYLDIEKIRFGDKIDYREHCPKPCGDVDVPSMILQPLFENAVKHGVYESLKPVPIRFECERNGSFLKLSLTNSVEPGSVSVKGEGIGLRNVRGRMERMYNHANLLDIVEEEGKFCVRLFVPIQES